MNLIENANRWNDHLVEHLLTLQVKQGHPRDIGGLFSPDKGFCEPASSPRMIDAFLAAYYSTQSRYAGQEKLLDAAWLALEHLNLNTHEDGTIDLLETNYHDSTANAFSTQVLMYTYRLMKRFSRHTPVEDTIETLILRFLKNSARAMLSGGFHTPNHRWVVASALALCYTEFGDEACCSLMRQYLDEGVDCDEEGEYTERSVGIYDIACDQSLLMILRETDMPELIEPVLRNLEKLPYYIEPDGTVATLNSRRQDFGKKLYPYPYLLNCLFALKTPHDETDGRYLRLTGLTEYLYRQYLEHGDTLTFPPDAGQFVTQFLLNPALAECGYPGVPMATAYKKFFPRAGVARARMGKAALTLVRGRPGFLKLQIGDMTLMLRAASTFFGVGQLISDGIEAVENGWRLRRRSEGGYMRPLGKAAGSTVWEEIPHDKRELVNVQKLDWTLDVLAFDDRIELHMDIDSCERLPWKLEAILSPGGELLTKEGAFSTGTGDTAILEHGFFYQRGDDTLRWSHGKKEHVYTVTMRNALPKEDKAFTVYNTGFAPGKHSITLTWD
ncbi:MAG: hypothetical protein JW811_06035 [Clostridiales bacterium]|nr:hypothetical protein [Clostridiales bacterium]